MRAKRKRANLTGHGDKGQRVDIIFDIADFFHAWILKKAFLVIFHKIGTITMFDRTFETKLTFSSWRSSLSISWILSVKWANFRVESWELEVLELSA